jgi:hypothetical protein
VCVDVYLWMLEDVAHRGELLKVVVEENGKHMEAR